MFYFLHFIFVNLVFTVEFVVHSRIFQRVLNRISLTRIELMKSINKFYLLRTIADSHSVFLRFTVKH